MEQNTAEFMKALSERQQSVERQLSELSALVKALEAKIASVSQPGSARPAKAAPPVAIKPKPAEVSPEVLVMLAAAATAYLGKEVRIRSAKMLQSPYEVINPWAQQGRVFIQASHYARFGR